MTATDATGLRACRECGNLGLVADTDGGRPRCCDAPMAPVEDSDGSISPEEPALADLLSTVFDMTGAELDVCLCVMEGGELTVAELAERAGYDRSVVARHLNHLAELGVVEKRRQLLERGGDVYVYTPAAPAVVRERFRRSFLAWAGAAADRIDELSREKVEAIVDDERSEAGWAIFREA